MMGQPSGVVDVEHEVNNINKKQAVILFIDNLIMFVTEVKYSSAIVFCKAGDKTVLFFVHKQKML